MVGALGCNVECFRGASIGASGFGGIEMFISGIRGTTKRLQWNLFKQRNSIRLHDTEFRRTSERSWRIGRFYKGSSFDWLDHCQRWIPDRTSRDSPTSRSRKLGCHWASESHMTSRSGLRHFGSSDSSYCIHRIYFSIQNSKLLPLSHLNFPFQNITTKRGFKILSKLPSTHPTTVILQYTSSLSFTKLFFISIIQKPLIQKNYHLLLGDDKNLPTIGIRQITPKKFWLQNYNQYIIIPANIARHLLYFENGKFFECNQKYASRVPENATFYLPREATGALSKLIDRFIETGQIPFMSFGTLLGKSG